MNREKAAAIRARIEQAKDETPSTSMFVWWVPVFVAMAWLTATTPQVEPETVVCVLGWCL